ncbi:MAG: leucyl/phenylalanyl-tRNA--protein transferase [Alphaproteobacteria bacterium]|nr:leucyl/phenylalanyl-tRNA--protein transferase [Alphaproteobacteria bacterium]
MIGLTPQLLLGAYASGVFPMAKSRAEKDLYWIDPDVRGILPIDQFHIPRRLRKTLRQAPFRVACDQDFAGVVRACAEETGNRPETWINPEIERLYESLHDMGFAHSVECWRGPNLVGGLYGVAMGGAFFGESMFSLESDASKVALCHLVARLAAGGYKLLDTQFVTDHLGQFGAIEISRADYKKRLADALKAEAQFPSELSSGAVETFIQSITQMS